LLEAEEVEEQTIRLVEEAVLVVLDILKIYQYQILLGL